LNILKISDNRFEEVITDVQKEFGIHNAKSKDQYSAGFERLNKMRYDDFIFNSYILRIDGFEYRVNRAEQVYVYGANGVEFVRCKIKIGDKGVITALELSGVIYDQLKKDISMTKREKDIAMMDAIYNTVVPVLCFEYYVMRTMESRNVTTVDLEEVQTVVKTSKPGNKAKKKNKPRVTKEITLNFKDIERVVYSRPELPRTYTHHVESFDVAGHYRHYKSGKVVFVKGYTKGNKDAKQISDKTYKINL
jgi:hypothetical protein